MQIFVKIEPGRTLSLDVEAEDTIDSGKAQISASDVPPLDILRLIHGADPQLQDWKTLLEYGIIEGGIIHAVLEPQIFEFLMKVRAKKRRRLIDKLWNVQDQLHRLQLESDEEGEQEVEPDAPSDAAALAAEPPLRQANVEENLEGQRPARLWSRRLAP